MKKLFTLSAAMVLAFTFSTTAFSQSWGFAQPGNWVFDVTPGPDGTTFASGYGGFLPDLSDVTPGYIVKLDANGEKIWDGAPAGLPWAYGYANSIMPTVDGGAAVYVAADANNPEIYRVDADGNLVWTTDTWDGTSYLYGGQAALLNDGSMVIGGLGDFEHEFYVVDALGNLLTTWSVAPDTATEWVLGYYNYKETDIVATLGGGFVYATGNESSAILYKYDSDYTLAWSSYLPWELEWEYGMTNTLDITSDGGYLLCGSGSDAGNYYGTVRKLDADGNLEWYTALNHGSAYEEGAWGAELGEGNYVVFTQDAGENSTYGWILDGNTGAEIGSIFVPIVNGFGGFSETGMEVYDVQSTPDGGYLVAGRIWMEDFTQRFTVIKSNADGSFDDCIFNCVWPGDANNDGYADGSDLFEIGINYGATGTPRADMTIDWSGKLAHAWMEPDTTYWYIINDLKWTDCNGDGTINDDDTTAVISNIGLDHPLNNVRLMDGEAPLYFAPVDDMLHIGLNEVPIMLGDDITGVDAIYGITFTVNVDATVVDASSLKINFNDSWIGNVGETLSFSKNYGDTKQAVGTIVRKDRHNTSGDGQIGTLSIVIVDNISGKTDAEEVELSFSGATAIKLNRDVVPLTTSTLTISAEDNSAINNISNNGILIYPNPASEILYLNNTSNEILVSIKITDILGNIVFENLQPDANNNAIDISAFVAGNYFVAVSTDKSVSIETISIQ